MLSLQVWRSHSLGHLFLLGDFNRVRTLPNGGPLRLSPYPPTALGRVPEQVLQRRGSPLHPILIRGYHRTGGGRPILKMQIIFSE